MAKGQGTGALGFKGWIFLGGLFFGLFFLLFLGFPTKKTCFLLFLGFSSGKQQFPSVVDGFGVIFRCFPTKKT